MADLHKPAEIAGRVEKAGAVALAYHFAFRGQHG